MIEAGSVQGIPEILRVGVAFLAFVTDDAFGLAEATTVISVAAYSLEELIQIVVTDKSKTKEH